MNLSMTSKSEPSDSVQADHSAQTTKEKKAIRTRERHQDEHTYEVGKLNAAERDHRSAVSARHSALLTLRRFEERMRWKAN